MQAVAPATPSFLHRLAFLRRPALLFALPAATGLLLLAGSEAQEAFNYASNETTNLWLRLSHVAAALLLLLLGLLWLPVLHNLLRPVRYTRWARYLPLNGNRLHRLGGYALLLFSLGHGATQLVYYDTLAIPFSDALLGREADLVRSMRSTMYEFVSEDESIERIADWIAAGGSEARFQQEILPLLQEDCTKCHSHSSTQTYAIPSLPLGSYQEALALSHSGIASRQFRINASGIGLLLLFGLISLAAVAPLRRRYHHCFQQLHRLGYLALPLLLLHIPAWYWLLPALLLLLLDKCLQHQRLSRRGLRAHGRLLGADTLALHIHCGHTRAARPGDYVRLRVPAISRSQWHPFSICRVGADGTLLLKIRLCGDWTRRLGQRIECEQGRLRLDLRGPYPSPASHSRHSRQRLLIAAGIGVTPFWSWLERHAADGAVTTLVWVLRDASALRWLDAVEGFPAGLDVRLYLTGQAGEVPDWLRQHAAVSILQGRPCWEQLAQTLAPQAPGDCYLCAPPGLMRQAGRVLRRHRWTVFKEAF